MWFKKKSVLQAEGHYNSNTAVNGTDWRTNGNYNSWSVSQTLPSAADANKYFYLPALGYYYYGRLYDVGDFGYYWSSSAYPQSSNNACLLRFYSGNVYVAYSYRYYGFRAEAFQ